MMHEPNFLVLGGESYELKPDFALLTRLEEAFNRPLLDIAELFINGEASLATTVDALTIILPWPSSRVALGEELVGTGIGKIIAALQRFFLEALGIEDS